MVGRLLGAAGGAVLVGFLGAGCGFGPDRDEPVEVVHTPGPDQGRDERDPEVSVTNDEVIVIVEDGADVHDECANREVVVSADDATVVLDGECGLVRATGRGSVVEVGAAEKIVLVGVDNQVSFASGDPEVVNQGRNTTVSEGGTALR
ncbi:hypothetical protein GCM10007079_32500 [Nocardiopsis terrae]|uniref:DUF3060 domain-containing protein n=1 Tax=Nocardiopsis terrae TaxID=372655 RepID=A0ABR9HJ88_9ACTN|nr:DUF3060 domain-containing protein [Nocardiopsis terrae]MBE1459068.1 hypothetical protein [Nocardiopsis terrae]GHC87933.1 hypothetical protein GCM10007079_32500 [Nocardiopsis terrae]